MQSLLGRIVEICSDETRHKITIEPLCTLPNRKAPPDHLKGQKLTFERPISDDSPHGESGLPKAFTNDARELGVMGDSIALTVGESLKFLQPLRCWTGNLLLFWWKDENPPDWTAKANGRTRTGKWQRDESRRLWDAQLSGADFGLPDQLNLTIEATCGSVKAHFFFWDKFSPRPTVCRAETNSGAEFNLQNRFASVHVTAHDGGAVQEIFSLGPTFLSGIGLIHNRLDWGGHTDLFRSGWGEWNSMRDKTLETGGTMREGNASRVTMEGEIEDDLRTQFSVTLLDDWPLLLMRRDFSLHAKKDEKKDELKQPIDEMRLFQYGFRCAVPPDSKASRVWCRADGETMAFSLARENEHRNFWHWKMENGWALFDQVRGRQFLLYFFDAENAPHLGLWRGPHVATLEPFWAGVPLKAGDSVGFSLGLAAGEIGGANEWGAWVACRTIQNGKWHCAIVARLENPKCEAVFQMGDETQHMPLTTLYLPGIGTVYGAKAEFQNANEQSKFASHVERSEA